MNTPIRPTGIAGPAANYELAVTLTSDSRLLFTAGIVGTRPDGTIAADIGEQAAEMWRSVGVVLTAAGFSVADIASYTTYAVVGNDLGAAMAARDLFFGDHRAASTLIPVPALARSEWLVEVTVVAASRF